MRRNPDSLAPLAETVAALAAEWPPAAAAVLVSTPAMAAVPPAVAVVRSTLPTFVTPLSWPQSPLVVDS